MKFQILVFLFIVVTNGINAQEILILNQQNNMPVENVAVFNKSGSVIVYTGSEGKVNLSAFGRNDSIFFKHPSIDQAFCLSLQDIRDMNYVIYLDKRSIIMDDIVVTASRWQERKRDIPFMTDVIRVGDTRLLPMQTSADILATTGNLMVQKSQGGAGSPVIRGFEANRLLLVIDGVRMNNAIYRSGHLQNSMTVDMGGIDKIEIIYGPSSVIYGSDALGGVIHYYTRTPSLSSKGLKAGANGAVQYSSANHARIMHLGIEAATKNIAVYSGFTNSNFGDIRMGKNRNNYPDRHGKAFYTIAQGATKDSLSLTENANVQPGTGYSQFDMTHKILIQLGTASRLIGNVQYSTSSNINRYDELYNFPDNKPSFAAWYYGPQNRFFSSVQFLSATPARLFSEVSIVAAWQKIDEDRINRKFNRANELHQEEDVKVTSLNVDFRKNLKGNQKIEYGFEASYNDVQSVGYNINIRTNTRTGALSRYPDKGSYVSSVSGYGGYKWNASEKLKLSAGARYSHSFLFSRFSDAFDMIPFSTVDISTGALTGSGSVIYNPVRSLKLSLILSTGFRAPNVDDYGKVRAKDKEVTLPNNRLKSEYAQNAEIGIMKSFAGAVNVGGNFFITRLTDAIVNSFWSFNGKDSLLYNGDMYRVVANTNSSEAYVTGFSLFFNADFAKWVQLKNTFNYTKGKDVSNNVPLGHIPPIFGRSSLSFDKGFFRSEIFVVYHGWKHASDYSPTGEDNLNYATEKGTPAWTTFNINTSASLTKYVQMQFAIENIFDTYYRVFASGVSAPGRNFIITLKASI